MISVLFVVIFFGCLAVVGWMAYKSPTVAPTRKAVAETSKPTKP